MGAAVRLCGISKRFGTFAANSNISLSVEEGSIHALVGENGAGKSTLTKIIYGMIQPSEGEVYIQGKPVHFSSPPRSHRCRGRYGASTLYADTHTYCC